VIVLFFPVPAGTPGSLDPPRVSVGENPLPEHKGRDREWFCKTGSFCKTEPLSGDFKNVEHSGVPKIRGIGEKRYNNVISGPVKAPDAIFFVVIQNPG
jgi:hypothetical protein